MESSGRSRDWMGCTRTMLIHRRQVAAAPPFAALQDTMLLPQAFAGLHEFLRAGGVELEHIVMTRDHASGADVLCQLSCLRGAQIARHTALRFGSVDRQQCH